jgi:phenylpyruvate tautomerase PptA (4-oxalocrotonate tautomerase family)
MPLLKLETTVVLSEDKREALLVSLSKAVAETIGKPEQYVMVTASQAAMVMSGKPGDAAFVDIRSIGGLSDDVNPRS